jgi:hypothetical protein
MVGNVKDAGGLVKLCKVNEHAPFHEVLVVAIPLILHAPTDVTPAELASEIARPDAVPAV